MLRRLPVVLLIGFAALSSVKPAPRVSTVQFHSQLINATLPYNVILPVDYDSSTTTRYPVLYLLHGLSGHYSDWVTRTNLADYAAEYRMIIVTPEGSNSWYTDSEQAPNERYETYIIDELIPDVDARYRTIRTRLGRGIAGLSMGGYGAFKFGLKHPGSFIFAGSLSGAFNVTARTEQETPAGSPYESVLRVFGPLNSPRRKANDVYEIVRDLSAARIAALPYFYFDCGTEDALFKANRDLDTLMLEKKIPHEFRELPGNHSWDYWDRQGAELLRVAVKYLQLPPPRRPMQGRGNGNVRHGVSPRP